MVRTAVSAVIAIALSIALTTSVADAAPRKGARPKAPPSCAKVEKSKRQAGRIAQLLAIAACHHKTGQYKAAWYEYTEAAARAREKKDKRSLKLAEKGIQQNAGLLAWITVNADSEATIEVDREKTVSGAKKAVDPGKHTITVAGANRAAPWSTTLDLQSGDVEEIAAPPPEPSAAPVAEAPSPAPTPGPAAPAAASASPSAAAEPAGEDAAADKPTESAAEDEPAHEPHTGVVADIEALVQVYDEPTAGSTERRDGQAFVFVGQVAYDFTPEVRAFLRYGLVDNYAPGRAHAASLSNAWLGASYGISPFRWLRVVGEAGVIVPIGTGSGDEPPAGITVANVRARALHPTLFDPNYITPSIGVSATASYARVVGRLELGLDPSFQVRGGDANESAKTRFRIAAHGGYRVHRYIEPFVEARWFRFVSSPAFVEADAALADNLFAGVGVAATLAPLRAQLAYLRALDAPLSRDDFAVFAIRLGIDF